MTKEQIQRDENRPADSPTDGELLNRAADREAQIQIKSRLMDNMAYQIRTLSNAVIGFSELLLSEGLTQDQIEYIQEINHAGYGLSTLVNEVLDWTQVLSGNLTVKKSPCEMSEIIQRLEQVLSAAVMKKGLDYQIVTDPMIPTHIFSDDEQLLRCLLNLIANAIRFTSQGSVRVNVLLEGGVSGPVVCFDVIDSGVGVDEEKAAHLFESQDYQIGSDQGLLILLDMGLKVTAGLPLTKQLVELLGGTIEVQSQAGAGSTFSLRIPVGMDMTSQIKPETAQTSEVMPARDDWQPTDTPVGTILLVEDQQANRTVISLMLEALGVEVETAADGEEALRKVEHNSYALILMDLKMPKMDGYKATQHLREQDIGIPIVALSAKVLNGDEHHQIAAMFDGFLTKPVDSHKLSKMLQKFITGFTPDPKTRSSEQDTVVLEYGN